MRQWYCVSLVLLLAISLAQANEPGEAWWSFRPLARPSLPATTLPVSDNPIDRFILAKLQEKGLTPSPRTDRRTFIRRVTFDLTGLPPTLEEIQAFVSDTRANAYDLLVDRLLASSAYGERMARLWMDIVHFAETHGHDQDRVRPNAWRYRDYLIDAFNSDTPYSQFIREQIAADVLARDQPQLMPALGFLAAGPWDESSLRDIREDSIDREIGRYLDRDDILTTVMNTFQGLTVQCARCHDHKFDPISQEEYYRLQAVFAGVGRGDVSYEPDRAIAKKRAELQGRFDAIAKNDPSVKEALDSGEFRKKVAAAETTLRAVSPVVLTEKQRHALKLELLRRQIAADLAALPPVAKVYAATGNFAPDGSHKPTASPRPIHLLKRGDIRRPGPVVEPGTLRCLPGMSAALELPANHSEGDRRAGLARWLSDASNPLTWRVMANRIWQQHFGRGLVETPNDFGKMGRRPTHPELLDYLAGDLREHQSLKKLHKLIVMSATYQQVSVTRAEAAKVDADNALVWRQNRARLDAEQVRDAILTASGRLDRRMGGPSDQQFEMKPGIHVTPLVDYGKFDWDRPQGHRRSVYRFIFRTLPDPLVTCLDGADASQITPKRTESVTPLQALSLLNSEFVLVHARAMAARLEKDLLVREAQIARACALVWGRLPTKAESKTLSDFATKHGLFNLCRVLFNSSEFLFAE